MMQQKPQEKQQMKTLKQIVKESDFANPKSPGDKAFVDKHIIQKTDYPVTPKGGSNDDVFSGKKQKRKKKRTDHEPDDKAVYEMSDAQMKRKEEITSVHYFIRATSNNFNSTTNETYFTQSVAGVKEIIPGMKQDPKTYITSVGLYNNANELIAVGKTAKPIKNEKEMILSFVVRFDTN